MTQHTREMAHVASGYLLLLLLSHVFNLRTVNVVFIETYA